MIGVFTLKNGPGSLLILMIHSSIKLSFFLFRQWNDKLGDFLASELQLGTQQYLELIAERSACQPHSEILSNDVTNFLRKVFSLLLTHFNADICPILSYSRIRRTIYQNVFLLGLSHDANMILHALEEMKVLS